MAEIGQRASDPGQGLESSGLVLWFRVQGLWFMYVGVFGFGSGCQFGTWTLTILRAWAMEPISKARLYGELKTSQASTDQEVVCKVSADWEPKRYCTAKPFSKKSPGLEPQALLHAHQKLWKNKELLGPVC